MIFTRIFDPQLSKTLVSDEAATINPKTVLYSSYKDDSGRGGPRHVELQQYKQCGML